MRRIPTVLLTGLTLFTLFTLSSLATAQQGGGRFGRGDGEAPKLENFTFEEGTLKSDKVRNGEAGYGIYLPKGYADEANKDTKYPVVIWLHGFGEQAIINIVTNGKVNEMPAQAGKLTDAQIHVLASYVWGLSNKGGAPAAAAAAPAAKP